MSSTAWMKGPIKSEKLRRIYARYHSISGVVTALALDGIVVSRSTVHVWLKNAGVHLAGTGRRPGTGKRYSNVAHVKRAQRVKAGQAADGVERVPCPSGRHWGGQVLLCATLSEHGCKVCTRGYDHSVREVMTSSNSGCSGASSGRRKGSYHED